MFAVVVMDYMIAEDVGCASGDTCPHGTIPREVGLPKCVCVCVYTCSISFPRQQYTLYLHNSCQLFGVIALRPDWS